MYVIKEGGVKRIKEPSAGNQNVIVEFSEVWENERASLRKGKDEESNFSSKALLPTDRPQWSDEDGEAKEDPLHIYEPSIMWEWMGEWQIDSVSMPGMSPEGWLYAFNWGGDWSVECSSSSFVRRRRWIRRRILHRSTVKMIEARHTESFMERIKNLCTDKEKLDLIDEISAEIIAQTPLHKLISCFEFECSRMEVVHKINEKMPFDAVMKKSIIHLFFLARNKRKLMSL